MNLTKHDYYEAARVEQSKNRHGDPRITAALALLYTAFLTFVLLWVYL